MLNYYCACGTQLETADEDQGEITFAQCETCVAVAEATLGLIARKDGPLTLEGMRQIAADALAAMGGAK